MNKLIWTIGPLPPTSTVRRAANINRRAETMEYATWQVAQMNYSDYASDRHYRQNWMLSIDSYAQELCQACNELIAKLQE